MRNLSYRFLGCGKLKSLISLFSCYYSPGKAANTLIVLVATGETDDKKEKTPNKVT
jgi:hypothetical protein